MRVLVAGIAGAIVMYAWASVAHLSPLATIGVQTLPNEGLIVGVLQSNLYNRGGVYVFPSPRGDQAKAGVKTTSEGLLAYSRASGALMPRRLGIEFALEVVESLLLALVAALATKDFGTRVRLAALVGLIAGLATNGSYWNWYGFGLDYSLANAFIEAMKFVVAGLAIAAVLRPRAAASLAAPAHSLPDQ
ncbi:MAG TPA: hypothetical protein VMU37_06110 [Caulobacteraceae bacterium]|nr:hypothetical protein [Caulobacteraceae bacterium]